MYTSASFISVRGQRNERKYAPAGLYFTHIQTHTHTHTHNYFPLRNSDGFTIAANSSAVRIKHLEIIGSYHQSDTHSHTQSAVLSF